MGYDVYRDDARFVEVFKGLYIAGRRRSHRKRQRLGLHGTELPASGFSIYGRNRVEEDPTLIRDTVGMVYMFYDKDFKAGNRSINTVRHDYAGIADRPRSARRRAAAERQHRGLGPKGGVISEVTSRRSSSTPWSVSSLEANAEEGRSFTTLAFNRALMSIYFTGGDYAWEKIDANEVAPLMSAAIDRLGAYTPTTRHSNPCPTTTSTRRNTTTLTLNYGGYINRSRALLRARHLRATSRGCGTDTSRRRPRPAEARWTSRRSPTARSTSGRGLRPLHQRFRQGAGHAGRGYAAPVALDLTYTLMK